MFEIEIKNLKTRAKIGISSQERRKYQTLLITCRFKYSVISKKKIDDINYLKDYSSIVKFLKTFVEKSHYKSLERLVLECKDAAKKKYKLKKIFISINKVEVAKRYGCESLSVAK
tara:strand:- start:888 stop:1232 length:345 start_codon:yes stop_codon:yes gene_type:complete